MKKYYSQIGSWNPTNRGENEKYLSCHHLVLNTLLIFDDRKCKDPHSNLPGSILWLFWSSGPPATRLWLLLPGSTQRVWAVFKTKPFKIGSVRGMLHPCYFFAGGVEASTVPYVLYKSNQTQDCCSNGPAKYPNINASHHSWFELGGIGDTELLSLNNPICEQFKQGAVQVEIKQIHSLRWWYCWWFRNPKQPPGMYQTLKVIGYLPYQLVQDFFHQHYHWWQVLFKSGLRDSFFFRPQYQMLKPTKNTILQSSINPLQMLGWFTWGISRKESLQLEFGWLSRRFQSARYRRPTNAMESTGLFVSSLN